MVSVADGVSSDKPGSCVDCPDSAPWRDFDPPTASDTAWWVAQSSVHPSPLSRIPAGHDADLEFFAVPLKTATDTRPPASRPTRPPLSDHLRDEAAWYAFLDSPESVLIADLLSAAADFARCHGIVTTAEFRTLLAHRGGLPVTEKGDVL